MCVYVINPYDHVYMLSLRLVTSSTFSLTDVRPKFQGISPQQMALDGFIMPCRRLDSAYPNGYMYTVYHVEMYREDPHNLYGLRNGTVPSGDVKIAKWKMVQLKCHELSH